MLAWRAKGAASHTEVEVRDGNHDAREEQEQQNPGGGGWSRGDRGECLRAWPGLSAAGRRDRRDDRAGRALSVEPIERRRCRSGRYRDPATDADRRVRVDGQGSGVPRAGRRPGLRHSRQGPAGIRGDRQKHQIIHRARRRSEGVRRGRRPSRGDGQGGERQSASVRPDGRQLKRFCDAGPQYAGACGDGGASAGAGGAGQQSAGAGRDHIESKRVRRLRQGFAGVQVGACQSGGIGGDGRQRTGVQDACRRSQCDERIVEGPRRVRGDRQERKRDAAAGARFASRDGAAGSGEQSPGIRRAVRQSASLPVGGDERSSIPVEWLVARRAQRANGISDEQEPERDGGYGVKSAGVRGTRQLAARAGGAGQ